MELFETNHTYLHYGLKRLSKSFDLCTKISILNISLKKRTQEARR